MKKSSLVFLAIVFLSVACTKETITNTGNDPLPTIGDAPEINLLSVNKTQVQPYVDSLVFTIQYLDGNGDLGYSDPDEPSIQLIDNRDPDILVFDYFLPPQGPDTMLILQGTLDIVLSHTILIDDSNTSETTTFSIRLKDRAGNWSNTVETETITVVE